MTCTLRIIILNKNRDVTIMEFAKKKYNNCMIITIYNRTVPLEAGIHKRERIIQTHIMADRTR